MICPNCGYMMDAFEKVCPRCKGEKIAAPPRQATPPPSPPTQPNLPYKPPSSNEPKPPLVNPNQATVYALEGFCIGAFLGWNAIAFTQGTQATAAIAACVGGAICAVIGLMIGSD